jgi:4-hydroxybenzoate polyprenyltransferase
VSHAGAVRRFLVAVLALVAVGYWLGVLPFAFGWVGLILLADFGRWARHWFTKNVGVVGVGAFLQLAAGWRLAAPTAPMPWATPLLLSTLLGVSMCLQDLRDVAGDRATGRRTLPIVIGDRTARRVLAAWFAVQPVLLHFGLVAPLRAGPAGLLADGVLVGLSLAIATRVVSLRTPEADHHTYLLLPLLYCAQVTVPLVLG